MDEITILANWVVDNTIIATARPEIIDGESILHITGTFTPEELRQFASKIKEFD